MKNVQIITVSFEDNDSNVFVMPTTETHTTDQVVSGLIELLSEEAGLEPEEIAEVIQTHTVQNNTHLFRDEGGLYIITVG